MNNNYLKNYDYKPRYKKSYKNTIPCIITKNKHLANLISKKYITPIIIKDDYYHLYLNQISYNLPNKKK
jgi:hypothetical protein